MIPKRSMSVPLGRLPVGGVTLAIAAVTLGSVDMMTASTQVNAKLGNFDCTISVGTLFAW